MDFNQIITNRLQPLLNRKGFRVTEEFKNYLKFKSKLVEIVISYNELEKKCYIELGKANDLLYPLDENVIKNIFGIEIKIDNVNPEIFTSNLLFFFDKEGQILLNGEIQTLNAIKKYTYNLSEKYTFDLLKNQNIKQADKAWEIQDYNNFVKFIDLVGKENLSSSYELKYKIANQKAKN